MATAPSRDDREDFQLPQPGLFADVDSGVGSVAFTDDFLQLEPALQISIMQDWHLAMGAYLRELHVQQFRRVTASHETMGLPEKIAQYRKHCAEIGIDVPNNFTLFLQQS